MRQFNLKISFLIGSLFLIGITMHILSPTHKLDVRPYYSILEAEEFFHRLSPSEVSNYFLGELLDLIFILNYTLLSIHFFKPLLTGNLGTILFLPGLLDLVETGSILLKLKGHQISLSLLSYSTSGKWCAGLMVFFVVIYRIFRRPRLDA